MPAPERFGRISEIRLEDEASWRDRIFLTFDIDWANDTVIADTADLVEEAGVAATWFITHDTPLIARLSENPRFELGIHPNFNFLLNGDGRNGADAGEVLDRIHALVPRARSVRSHSMAQTSVLLNLFEERGLTHDCNHFVPAEAGIELKPWRIWNGMVKAPYFWEDDVYCMTGGNAAVAELAARPGLRIFDFHPTLIFMNCEAIEHYEEARAVIGDSAALLERRRADGCGGARDLLGQLLACR